MQGKNDAMRFIQTIKNQLDNENKNFRAAKIKNKENRRFLKFNTVDGEDGSQLCYPIIHPATGKVVYVITVAGDKKLCLAEKYLPLYTWLIDHFAMRISLEHSLLLIKEKACETK